MRLRLPSWNTRPMPNLGVMLLGIWLIATGLLPLLQVSVPFSGIILPLLAIAAGVMLLFEVRSSTLLMIVVMLGLVAGLVILLR